MATTFAMRLSDVVAPVHVGLSEAGRAAIRARLGGILVRLPQIARLDPVIAKARVGRWVDGLLASGQLDELADEQAMRQALWHARRMTGLPASSIGDAISQFRRAMQQQAGEDIDEAWLGDADSYTWKTARDIVADALLLAAPEPGSVHTRRGHAREPELRARMYGRGCESLTDILQGVAKHRHRRHPWMIGNPDDLLRLPDGRVALVDYKAPTAATLALYKKHGAPLKYAAQLHGYRALIADYCDKHGIDLKIDTMLLIMDDAFTGEPVVMEVPYDRDLDQAYVETGEHLWVEHVMQDVLPPAILEDRFAEDVVPPDAVLEASHRAVVAKQIAAVASEEADKAFETVLAWARREAGEKGLTLGDLQIKLSLSTLSAKREIDVEAAVSRMRALGGDPDDAAFRKPDTIDDKALKAQIKDLNKKAKAIAKAATKKDAVPSADVLALVEEIEGFEIPLAAGAPDPEKVRAWLLANGCDPAAFTTEKFSCRAVAVSGKSKDAVRVSEVRGLARDQVDNVIRTLGGPDLRTDQPDLPGPEAETVLAEPASELSP